TVELLLLSVAPVELMVGKILAMTVITAGQALVWLGGGQYILNRGARLLDVSAYTFPPGFWVLAGLFLVFGFLMYAAIMAAAGAISTNIREGGQVTWLLIVPLLPTLMFANAFLETPDAALPIALSLIPFSAPSAMVTRLALIPTPAWQVALSLGGVIAVACLAVWLAARFFQSGNLLSEEAFNWRRLATGWRRQERSTLER
ncbi:MAG: ABC transporter permease, partial [Chloroflexi bacterium]|nr:ABC transporter permease [Chloroflexota bacterium]